MTESRRLLPLHNGHTGRSAMTCLYRCGNACDHPVPNDPENAYFGELAERELSRRGVLQAAASGALVLGFGTAIADAAPAAAAPGDVALAGGLPSVKPSKPGALTFTPVAPNRLDSIVVPDGYEQAVVIRWGDEVVPGAPAFDPYHQTADAQSKQFGYNNDFVAVLPLDKDGTRALLVANHEYTNEELMFPGWVSQDALTVEQLKIAIAAHGMSVVELERVGDTGQWRPVRQGRRPYNRRITALSTQFTLTGPAAGSPLLHTAADPAGRTVIGTLNNCAGGVTPWGTILSGEENFNQYFVGGDGVPAEQKPALAADIDGSGKLPTDGAFNGTGQWLPLVRNGQSQVPGMTVDQVLVYTRLAADKLGPTKMDRPEDVEANPRTGFVYVALTNNTSRGAGTSPKADEANPRNVNRHGHILEIIEDRGDHTGKTFTWSVPIVCGDPADPSTYFAGYDKTKVSPISCPDNVMFDPAGNLWISTDGNALGSNDGLFATPLAGPERGHLKQFLTVPYGSETCGSVITDDGRSVFVAVQHPGEVTGATLENPASRWPDGNYAKPSIACVWRTDGQNAGI